MLGWDWISQLFSPSVQSFLFVLQRCVLSEHGIWSATFGEPSSKQMEARFSKKPLQPETEMLFLAGKQGGSFACKSVSISSITPTNYVSLSFTQLPAAPFQCPHLWLPINTIASRHSTTRQPPVAIMAFKYCFDLNEFSLLDSYSLMEAIITMVALVLQIQFSSDVLRTNRITRQSVCPNIHHLI